MRNVIGFFPALAIVFSLGMTGKTVRTIVCFGDSITHGAKVEGKSWVYFLSTGHNGVSFVNEGRNGRKTTDKDELLPILSRYKKADMFLIFLGVNDLKDGNDSMVNICVRNMKWMIDQIKKNDMRARIVILSPSDIDLKKMSPLNVRKKYNRNTQRSLVMLNRRYRSLSKTESVGFISLLNAVSPGNYVDGLHPNLAGQREIASAVWRGLVKLGMVSAK